MCIALAVALVLLGAAGLVYRWESIFPAADIVSGKANPLKLYWFIPDGLRADPDVFKLFEWAQSGELPNIKKMMEMGSYGYSIPVFPGHTPTNFATLLTGSTPGVHGVADGPMHIEGYPLQVVSKSGFSSVAKRVPPMWFTLEQSGEHVTVLSVPGSTPPELSRGTTIRGRWGGWGLDFPAVIFHTRDDLGLRLEQGPGNRVFEFGPELTKYIKASHTAGWEFEVPESFSPAREVVLSNWGANFFGYIYDSTDDAQENYDGVVFSKDKSTSWTSLKAGQWSGWMPITLEYQIGNDYNIHTPKKMSWERDLSTISLETQLKIKVIRLGKKDFFRIRVFYNNLNQYSSKPAHIAQELVDSAGPMVDFVDNFPPQLVYYDEDKSTFMEEAGMSLQWHKAAAGYLSGQAGTDVLIHDIYTPNQALTSRWWLGYLDPNSQRYSAVDDAERERLWKEMKKIYQGIDAIIGEVLLNAGPDTYVVLSSDHGAVPLNQEVRLNNLFAAKGLLAYSFDDQTGEYAIDWDNTYAVFLKMDGVYINPGGLGGNFNRASGPEYERLRARVTNILQELRDANGVNPLARVTPWEDAEYIDLPKDRVGDLVIANKAGFGWVETISENGKIFDEPNVTGYKQAVLPYDERGMWTPFIFIGPGVKKANRIDKPIRHIDQYPTIMALLGKTIPDFVEGRVVKEILESESGPPGD